MHAMLGTSGQWGCSKVLPHCWGAMGSGTPVVHCHIAVEHWTLVLFECTATPHWGPPLSPSGASPSTIAWGIPHIGFCSPAHGQLHGPAPISFSAQPLGNRIGPCPYRLLRLSSTGFA